MQIELVTKYDTKDAQRESLEGGSKSAKGGSYPLADLDRGVQIRCDTGNISTQVGCNWGFVIKNTISLQK